MEMSLNDYTFRNNSHQIWTYIILVLSMLTQLIHDDNSYFNVYSCFFKTIAHKTRHTFTQKDKPNDHGEVGY